MQACHSLGICHIKKPDHEAAIEPLERCRHLLQQIRSEDGQTYAEVCTSLGCCLTTARRHEEALKMHHVHLLFARKVENKSAEALALTNISAVYGAMKQNERYVETAEEALAIYTALGHTKNQGLIVMGLLSHYQAAARQNGGHFQDPEKVLELMQRVSDLNGCGNIYNLEHEGLQRGIESYTRLLDEGSEWHRVDIEDDSGMEDTQAGAETGPSLCGVEEPL